MAHSGDEGTPLDPTGTAETGAGVTGAGGSGAGGSGAGRPAPAGHASIAVDVAHVFVYGTLRPGESRWHHLQRFVVGDGVDDAAPGVLYDTGQGYPAAVFDDPGRIVGRTFSLRADSLADALAHLDEVEGAVRGLYVRVVVRTETGVAAFAYQYGNGLDLQPIASGDWLTR